MLGSNLVAWLTSHVVLPYSSTDTATAWKNSLFNLSVRSDFHMVDNLFMAIQAFPIVY